MSVNPIVKKVVAPVDVTHHHFNRNREDMLLLPPEHRDPARSANLGVDLVKPGTIPTTTIHTSTENTVRTDLTQDLDGIFATRNLGAVSPSQVVTGNNSKLRPTMVRTPPPHRLEGMMSTSNLMIAAVVGLAAVFLLKK